MGNTKSGDVTCKKAGAGAGGVGAIVAGMGQHLRDRDVQYRGCGALLAITSGDDDCKKAAAAAGVVHAVMAGTGQHVGDRSFQASASKLLGAIASLIPCKQPDICTS